MLKQRDYEIIDFIREQGICSSKEIFDNISSDLSFATLKRAIANLISENYIITKGNGRGTKYVISSAFELLQPIDIDIYFKKEIDEREINKCFNFQIITEVLSNNNLFTDNEMEKLEELQNIYQSNIVGLSKSEYQIELQRLAIDLSWKSSQIEGNTYSLLETERLLKEKKTASGKTKEEAIMLLNHKDALDFLFENPDYLTPLSISTIEDVHSILMKELEVERNLRKRRVGITGTNYQPLDNEFQIIEALKNTCDVINGKDSVFEKALLALVLISYIQPFIDGNKRTARIVSNAILLNEEYCPLSFRTVDSIEYKKAMLLFYEQNNISNFKEIFITQFEFAVNTYF